MTAGAFLMGAILLEVCGTLSLRMAASGHRAWYLGVAAGYSAAFACLALTLQAGLGLGAAYGIWAASGVALVAVASRLLFREPLTPVMMAGIGLIAAGVLVVEIGAGL